MFCKNCGNQLPDGTAFCGNCGTAQTQPAPVVEPAPIVPATPVAEQAPVVAAVPVATPVAAPPTIDNTVMVEQPAPFPQAEPAPMAQVPQGYAPAPAKKSHKGLIVAIIILLVVAILSGTAWVLYDNGTFDDLFGGSSSSSQEDDDDESKDDTSSGTSSDNSSAPADPNGTTSEEGVNSELNQGTIVTPPTSSVDSVKAYTAGATVNGVYTNQWANLKYDTSKANTTLTITSDAELAEKKGINYEYGFIFMDSTGQNLQLMFEDCTGANVTKEEYMDIVCNQVLLPYAQQGYSATISSKTTMVIAGQTYSASTITATASNGVNLVQKICVYKQGDYMIAIIASATNEVNANGMINIFETAY